MLDNFVVVTLALHLHNRKETRTVVAHDDEQGVRRQCSHGAFNQRVHLQHLLNDGLRESCTVRSASFVWSLAAASGAWRSDQGRACDLRERMVRERERTVQQLLLLMCA